MSEDKIKIVQSLLDSKKGDQTRLQQILTILQEGRSLDTTDQNYLEEVSKELQPSNLTLESSEHAERGSLNTPMQEEKKDESFENTMIQETKNSPSRKKVIVIVAVIAAIIAVYVGFDTYSVGTLQFRPNLGNQYQISPTEIHIQADVCNPSFFPVGFSKYEIVAFYNSEQIEKAEIGGTTISPKTMSTVDGVFALNADVILKLKQENTNFDPTLAKITTTVDAPIFGAIPFSIVKEYSAEKFQQVLRNGPPGSFSCS